MKKKWEIPGLKKTNEFDEAANTIIANKVKDVFKLINKYFKKQSVENLHFLRIGIRRLRYSLELFYLSFEPDVLKKVYNFAKYLQDLVGEGRDLDVIKIRLQIYQDEDNITIPLSLFEKIESDLKLHRREIKLQLRKFLNSKDIKKLLNINKEMKDET
ncbi:MAG: CHAD domain-containing protein [Ignavibacteriales bacterium]|nr:CHAD domain-containing protein [Ignavibacteriales bacterium]